MPPPAITNFDSFIPFSFPVSLRHLQERPLLQFFESLLEFTLGVHHDRTVPDYRLLQRLPRNQEEPDSFLACLYLYLITSVETSVEENERAIVSLRGRRRLQPSDSSRRNSERAGCVAELPPAPEHVRKRVASRFHGTSFPVSGRHG